MGHEQEGTICTGVCVVMVGHETSSGRSAMHEKMISDALLNPLEAVMRFNQNEVFAQEYVQSRGVEKLRKMHLGTF